MPLLPNPIERLLFVTTNQAPGPAIDLWSGTAFPVLLAALRLHLFAALQEQPADADDVAQRLKLDQRGTTLLLETLVALGYLKKRKERYHPTAMTDKWLTDAGSANMTPFFLFWGAMVEKLTPALTEAIRTGSPPLNLYDWLATEPEVARHFQEGLAAMTRLALPDIAPAIPVPARPTRLLDVGGGHAAYSIALCQQHPQLMAVVFDGEQALTLGRQAIATAGLGEQVQPQVGNFLVDDLGAGYDLLLLFNIIHGLTAEQNLALLHKAKAALNPGGRVVILDQIAGSVPLPMLNTAAHIFSLSFFLMVGGQLYTEAAIQQWLTTAGFGKVQRPRIVKAGSPLIIAERM